VLRSGVDVVTLITYLSHQATEIFPQSTEKPQSTDLRGM
jgi:hypothetical protein